MEKEWACNGDLVSSLKSFQMKLLAWKRDTVGHILRRKKRIHLRLEGIKRVLDVKWSPRLLKLDEKLREWTDLAARRTSLAL